MECSACFPVALPSQQAAIEKAALLPDYSWARIDLAPHWKVAQEASAEDWINRMLYWTKLESTKQLAASGSRVVDSLEVVSESLASLSHCLVAYRCPPLAPAGPGWAYCVPGSLSHRYCVPTSCNNQSSNSRNLTRYTSRTAECLGPACRLPPYSGPIRGGVYKRNYFLSQRDFVDN